MKTIPILGATKARILHQLATEDRTAGQVAAALGVQVSAARKHLERMREMGIVEERFLRKGKGRPKKLYGLTADGKELFPRAYDAVLNAVLASLVAARGPGATEAFLNSIAADLVRADGLPSARDRRSMGSVVAALTARGFEASLRPQEGAWVITSRNCPLLRAAQAHREIVCRGLHAEFIRRATGSPSVAREKWILDGGGICTHLVPRDGKAEPAS